MKCYFRIIIYKIVIKKYTVYFFYKLNVIKVMDSIILYIVLAIRYNYSLNIYIIKIRDLCFMYTIVSNTSNNSMHYNITLYLIPFYFWTQHCYIYKLINETIVYVIITIIILINFLLFINNERYFFILNVVFKFILDESFVWGY